MINLLVFAVSFAVKFKNKKKAYFIATLIDVPLIYSAVHILIEMSKH